MSSYAVLSLQRSLQILQNCGWPAILRRGIPLWRINWVQLSPANSGLAHRANRFWFSAINYFILEWKANHFRERTAYREINFFCFNTTSITILCQSNKQNKTKKREKEYCMCSHLTNFGSHWNSYFLYWSNKKQVINTSTLKWFSLSSWFIPLNNFSRFIQYGPNSIKHSTLCILAFQKRLCICML